MPQYRSVTNVDHGLWDILRTGVKPHSKSAAKQDNLHECYLLFILNSSIRFSFMRIINLYLWDWNNEFSTPDFYK